MAEGPGGRSRFRRCLAPSAPLAASCSQLNPHVHVLVRGVAADGADLVIDRAYISHGLRDRAEARVTLELGPRSEREIQRALGQEVEADRWTSLDRALRSRASEDGTVDMRPEAGSVPDRRTLLLTGRAQKLERLGLAMSDGPARWTLKPDIEPRLRELGDRGDIIKTMHRAMRETGHAIHENRLAIHPPGASEPVVGRLIARGLQDELIGTAYAIVDGVDGRHHHLRLSDLELTGDSAAGAIVEMRSWQDSKGVARSALAVRSDLPLDKQITARGATWLDRQLLARDFTPANNGFGAEVRDAMAAREDHLVAEGLATRTRGRITLAPNLIDKRVAQALVVETALTSFLSGDSGEHLEAVLSRRLDRLSRQAERLTWHVELGNETLALFVRFWLINNPPLPDTALAAAQAMGKERWERFVATLNRRMEFGPRLRTEISEDVGESDARGSERNEVS